MAVDLSSLLLKWKFLTVLIANGYCASNGVKSIYRLVVTSIQASLGETPLLGQWLGQWLDSYLPRYTHSWTGKTGASTVGYCHTRRLTPILDTGCSCWRQNNLHMWQESWVKYCCLGSTSLSQRQVNMGPHTLIFGRATLILKSIIWFQLIANQICSKRSYSTEEYEFKALHVTESLYLYIRKWHYMLHTISPKERKYENKDLDIV